MMGKEIPPKVIAYANRISACVQSLVGALESLFLSKCKDDTAWCKSKPEHIVRVVCIVEISICQHT